MGGEEDHPRIRGEHHRRRPVGAGRARIIPAYAGSTHAVERARIEGPDHPRIRGEHLLSGVGGQDPAGSSPHTRGALSDAWRHWPVSGIIPAYAGSTSRLSRWRDSSPGSSPHTRGAPPDSPGGGTAPPDHPRIRGEHRRCHRRVRRRAGSSPHTRGARAAAGRSGGIGGIIPAYAGSTTVLGRVLDPRKDHPRIRGEHLVRAPAADEATGSSPHTRGARLIASWWAFRSGIIPAYAGSTRAWLGPVGSQTDHPRIRGEHVDDSWVTGAAAGSSPHTRGALKQLIGPGNSARIIPAYAGSTILTLRVVEAMRDHPRIRGEHEETPIVPALAQGIIPAYAGSTTLVQFLLYRTRRSSPHTRGAPEGKEGKP